MARKWESIICYEDRSEVHTSRWRLSGVKTIKGATQNTDSGVLWANLTKAANTVIADIYKDDGLASGNKVATGTADVSTVDGTGENAVELTLAEANSSGVTGSFYIHQYQSDPDHAIPIQVAFCVDEDMDSLWDDIENLPGYDSTYGCAEYIRVAGDMVLGVVAKVFKEQLGGQAAPEEWYIPDASRLYPDLRRIANPGQLRYACACKALSLALGRSHERAAETMYSLLRDYFDAECGKALGSLVLAFKPGSGDNATAHQSSQTVHQWRA